MSPHRRHRVALGLRLALASLFVVAGALKLRDPQAFAIQIADYQVFPALAPYLAVVLPPTELLLALALLFAPLRWRLAAATGLALLMLLFMGAALAALAQGVNVECGCFGSASGRLSALTLLRDGVIVTAALGIIRLEAVNVR